MKMNWTVWLFILLSLPLLLALLVVVNSFWSGSHIVEAGLTSSPPLRGPVKNIKLMSYNIRWCKESESCLDRVAALIQDEKPDMVFLAAIYHECATCSVKDQVTYLAEKAGFHSYAFAENYNVGVPFYRFRSGNALLSRFPLREPYAQRLPGDGYDPRARRRILWAVVDINGKSIRVASLHNSASSPDQNLIEVGEILAYAGDDSTLLGGDFNATPESLSMQTLRRGGRFIGDFDGPNTYPTKSPDRRLDYILAPGDWHAVAHRVLEIDYSAHLPVVSTFAIPTAR
jgi:endonuclease/exonuclease/phosphatase family metal-dependent hydrolase